MKYFYRENLNHSNAFTLAEVLITLVIIGVIAAMTVPAIMQNANESATVSKVKKAQSILAQAKILAEAQNGPVLDWDFGSGYTPAVEAQFWSYIRPYIQVAQDCGAGYNCYKAENIFWLNGTVNGANYATNQYYYKFVLSDGSVMWFRTGLGGKCATSDGGYTNVCAYFMIDTNGDKAPNTAGRDIFVFEFTPEGVFPNSSNTCNKNSNGYGCAAYIIKNSNMNYLH